MKIKFNLFNWGKKTESTGNQNIDSDIVSFHKDTSPEDKKNKSKGEVIEQLDPTSGYQKMTGDLTYSQMYEFYKKNEWVRACIDLIVGTCAKVKIKISPVKEEDEISPETQQHIEEVEALFNNPNAKDESFEMIRRKVLKDILTYDAGAIEIVYDGDKPYELYDLPGDRMRVSVDEHGYYNEKAFYLIPRTKDGTVWDKKDGVPFSQEEVIYFMRNPRAGSVYGLSPIESLVNSIESDLNASEYNSNFFLNNAQPSGIINLPGISKSELIRFKEQWRRDLKSYKNAHKLFITNIEKGIEWEKTSESAEDMQFMEYQKWLVQKILTVYQVKPFVLGLVDETTGKLNSAEQWNAFKESAIDPLLSLEAYLYTTKIINAGFGYNDIKVEFEPIDIKDEVAETERAVKLVTARIMTVNEVRKKFFNLPEVDWGNQPYEGPAPLGLSITPVTTKNISENNETPKGENIDIVQEKIKEILSRRTKKNVK
jgi:HK97 family phage portal protein